MGYTYITVDVLKGTGALNATSTAYDTRLRQLGEGISVAVDNYVNRTFQPLVGTKLFSGDGGTFLDVPDLVAVGTLLEDNNGDGTYNVEWGTNDYFLEPHNADPTSERGRPYTLLQVSDRTNGTQDVFLDGIRNYNIDGTWGYISVTKNTGRTPSGDIDSTATSIDLDGTAAEAIEVGMTIQVGTEQMYVEAIGSGTGTSVTVERAVNGSTAGSHGSTATISSFTYPGPVREAVLIQTARLWKRRESAYASQVGIPESGQMSVWTTGLDPDVKVMLAPYRRFTV